MGLTFGELRSKDYKRAIEFAITGMHFDWYIDNKWLLLLNVRHFLYQELLKATQVIAVYENGEIAGLLLAEIKGEDRKCRSLGKRIYIRLVELLQRVFVRGGAGAYHAANAEMFREYSRQNIPEGELLFLAADPEAQGKGIGSMLLRELEEREKGKKVFLYTDSGCTYQFYEHRGFERAEERAVTIEMNGKKTRIDCFLYSKVLGDNRC